MRLRLQRAGWSLMAVLVGVVWAACAAGESLWVDELHSSWTVSGAWDEVSARARQGNQSPLYFYVLFGVTRTLGSLGGIPGELLLRLPSVVCWAGTLFVCLRIIPQTRVLSSGGKAVLAMPAGWIRRGWRHAIDRSHALVEEQLAEPRFADGPLAAGVAVALWLLLDRIQLFYATEARVYAMVQLISLLAWCCIARVAVCASPQTVSRSILLWCGLSVLLISLHLTAVLACVWQIACGTWIVARRHPQGRGVWAAAVMVVLLTLAVAWQLSSQVWQHRQQWASFAGDASWSRLIALFPVAAYLVPVAAARGLDLLCSLGWFVKPLADRRARPGAPPSPLGLNASEWLWWIAAAGPWLSAWCITALDIAPVFHRRFVIVAAIPLLLVAATQLARIRRPSLRWLAVLGVGVWLALSQGTLDNWRNGAWYGWQRSEGWRQASQLLQAQMKPGDSVWCCSGLIEANEASWPLTEPLNRYLSFPLRGLYCVVNSQGKPLAPHALIGDGASWRGQLRAADRPTKDRPRDAQDGAAEVPAERLAAEAAATGDQWIVYRGRPASFRQHLRLLGQADATGETVTWRIGEPQAFGLVSVVRLSRVEPTQAD